MVGTPAWSSDQSVLGWAGTKKSCRPVVPEACSQDAWASPGTHEQSRLLGPTPCPLKSATLPFHEMVRLIRVHLEVCAVPTGPHFLA